MLEATAYQTREVLDAMEKDSGVRLKALKVDGGMVFNELLMQFQADLLDVPVIRPKVAETTALGAAYAAGLAVGFWKNLDELRLNWGKDKEWKPQMEASKRDETLCRLEKGRFADFRLGGIGYLSLPDPIRQIDVYRLQPVDLKGLSMLT